MTATVKTPAPLRKDLRRIDHLVLTYALPAAAFLIYVGDRLRDSKEPQCHITFIDLFFSISELRVAATASSFQFGLDPTDPLITTTAMRRPVQLRLVAWRGDSRQSKR